MQIVEQSYEIFIPEGFTLISYLEDQAKQIERAARTCYKSENLITEDSYKKMLQMLRKNDHSAMLEFGGLTVKFITSRGVAHEFVRHRIPSFAQESTRYCNYAKDKFGNELTFIKPSTWESYTHKQQQWWTDAVKDDETRYLQGIEMGLTAQQARGVLPNDLKTEINVRTNFREWLHIFNLRCSPAAHPDIRALLEPLHDELAEILPCVFATK
jgi:thymidylate synthase (FAD)